MLTKLASALGFKKQEAKIIVIGLDDAGKSCIVNKLKEKKEYNKPPSAASFEKVGESKFSNSSKKSKPYESTPTVGFKTDEFERNSVKFQVYDMSGQSRYRNMWETYYQDVEAIIFVVDSSDKLRVCVAKEELEVLMENKSLLETDSPILFFANKMDVNGALSAEECAKELELDQIRDRSWHIVSSNGVDGYGIDEGITWLANTLKLKARGAYK